MITWHVVFFYLQKAFDTVDQNILLSKLCHHGIRWLANKWFESYLADCKQFVSVNSFASSISIITFGVPQGSVFGPFLFILYIDDLFIALKQSKVHHFADNTILLINKSVKRLNKPLNMDLINLTHWLSGNKISLNVSKKNLLFSSLKKILGFNIINKAKWEKIVSNRFS